MFLLLSPFFLMGLFFAGLLHVLVSKKQISAMVGDPGMKGVFISSALGITIPVCTCGVAPVGVELKRKGASRPAIISFLITTPETAVDAIMVTFGLLGPAMAIARPIFAYCMGIIGGFFGIGLLTDADQPLKSDQPIKCSHPHDHEHHSCELAEHLEENEPDFVGFHCLKNSLVHAPKRVWHRVSHSSSLYSWYRPEVSLPPQTQETLTPKEGPVLPLREIWSRIFNYSYKQLADEVLPGLIIGMLFAFLIFLLLPENLAKYGLGQGFFSYLLMLAAGMPLYVCASASTPIAAALIYQGVSPGAAMVFLLAGPATNTTTITILGRYFGARFLNVYLFSVMVGGVVSGMLFDRILHAFDLHVVANVSPTHGSITGIIQWASASALITLIIWRSWKGNLRGEFQELLENMRALLPVRGRSLLYALPIAFLVYLASGLTTVPPGAVGYVKIFGKVTDRNLKPGLHYIPPAPFAKMDLWYHAHPYQVTIGVPLAEMATGKHTQPELSSKLAQVAEAEEKEHQMPTAFEAKADPVFSYSEPISSDFFTGDENLLNISASVQYSISDPYKYFYQVSDQQVVIADLLRKSIFDSTASGAIMKLLSADREEYNQMISKDLTSKLEELGAHLISVNVTNLHPPVETLFSFRDVVSAREDRETADLKALKFLTETVLRTRGDAQVEVQRATALALSERLKAEGKTISIKARAEIVSGYRELLEELLWLETSERALSKQELYLLPPGYPPQKFSLWKNALVNTEEETSYKEEKSKKEESNHGSKKSS
ncbi:MAG: SO_0444 family Cu/Zn efflux transporter [Chlamydiales bacterium]|nr:SO_0444 family Cu/Zn efflux transporter [Chlamydiales bacterium]